MAKNLARLRQRRMRVGVCSVNKEMILCEKQSARKFYEKNISDLSLFNVEYDESVVRYE